MSSDPNKKSAKTFQCRDVLWATFEQMARELECSVDYLVNEAMKQYARQRSYPTRATPVPPANPRIGDPATAPPPAGSLYPSSGAPAPTGRASGLPPPPNRSSPPGASRPPTGSIPAPPMGNARTTNLGVPPPALRATGASAPASRGVPSAPRSLPPPLPRTTGAVPPAIPPMPAPTNGYGSSSVSAAPAGTLQITYQGERVAVTKERFVIGRGKQSSDLTLKDPNVSRQHAMIEFQNGVYFMVDMGSTNGVEYNGQRIARKQIAEGDVFRICDHDLFFSYR